MNSFTTWAFQSKNIISWGDSVLESFLESINQEGFEIEDNDVIVITSKVVSMEEEARAWLDDIVASDDAEKIAVESKMDPRVVQLVLDESEGEVLGSVFHAILSKSKYGLSANAGIDLSNSPEGYALLLPRDPDQYAREFRKKILERIGKDVAVLVTDSRTIPLKRGTTGVTLGLAGMKPIIDERGKKDLYGYKMSITTRAVADNLATVANVVMGETAERRPFAVIRGVDYEKSDNPKESMDSTMMPEDQCLYFAPLFKLLRGDDQWL